MASAVTTTTAKDSAVQVTLAATDVDGDALTFAVTTPPAHGTLGAISGGKVTYTPAANWNGADWFPTTRPTAHRNLTRHRHDHGDRGQRRPGRRCREHDHG